jgi:hypothetical protein
VFLSIGQEPPDLLQLEVKRNKPSNIFSNYPPTRVNNPILPYKIPSTKPAYISLGLTFSGKEIP